jgi:hypothetical protein
MTTLAANGLHSPVLSHGHLPVIDSTVAAFDHFEGVTLAAYGLPTLLAACKATASCTSVRYLHAWLSGRALDAYIG